MKNKICLLISALLFLATILIFTSCNSDDETTPLAKDEHVHVFSDGYMKSETEHWRYAVCEHKDEIIDKAEHLDANFDGFCDTCLFVMCSHSYGDPYERDSETHAYDPVCGCALDPITEEHKDEDKDGKCDMCNYKTEKAEEITVSLDGKRVIFIGDSFIYYGNTVLEKGTSQLTESKRLNDQGLFYQLCKQNGENVSVTNFTFGGHGLGSFTSRCCNTDKSCKGEDHFSYLTNLNYDYVVISGGRGSSITAESFLYDVGYIIDLFRAANPDVKFVYLVSSGAHNVSVKETFPVNILNNLDTVEDMGVTIVDWGAIVADVISGAVDVPGAMLNYNKNTFVVSKSSSDGYHPNQLAGYITTLMTYCAITGKSAVGQNWSFVGDSSLSNDSAYRSTEKYIEKYYTYNGAVTNYPEVLASEADMTGLQQLIDLYLADKKYRDYDF